MARPALSDSGGQAAHLHARLPREQHTTLFAVAQTIGITASEVVRFALDRYLPLLQAELESTGPPGKAA